MTTENTKKEYTIDASGKRMGRVATEAAAILRGKNDPAFMPNELANVTVTIENASKLDIPDNRKTEAYQSYSGYPGGLRSETLEHLAKRLGIGEVLRRTINGMLAKNKLRKPALKNLKIKH